MSVGLGTIWLPIQRFFEVRPVSLAASIVKISSITRLIALRTNAPDDMTKAALVQLSRTPAVQGVGDRR